MQEHLNKELERNFDNRQIKSSTNHDCMDYGREIGYSSSLRSTNIT